MRLANAQMVLEDDASAYTNYQAALVLSPNDPDAAMRLGEIELARGDAKSALDHFAIAMRAKRNNGSFTISSASLSRCRANMRWRARASRSGLS